MFAIKVIPNKRKMSEWYLLRDNEDYTVYIWTRRTEAEKALAKLQEGLSKFVILEITEDINVSDKEFEDAKKIFPNQTPSNKEEFYYRKIFVNHFPSNSSSLTVPSEPSIACSSKIALDWDKSFKNMNEPSGRAIKSVHNKSI